MSCKQNALPCVGNPKQFKITLGSLHLWHHHTAPALGAGKDFRPVRATPTLRLDKGTRPIQQHCGLHSLLLPTRKQP